MNKNDFNFQKKILKKVMLQYMIFFKKIVKSVSSIKDFKLTVIANFWFKIILKILTN